MEVIDNVNRFLGDDLKRSITPNAKVAIAASSFSIYAFEALKRELEHVDSLQFIFTTPTFVPSEVTERFAEKCGSFISLNLQRKRDSSGPSSSFG